MNKYLKYFLKGLGFFLAFLLLLYIGVYIYVLANKKSLITQVTAEAGKKLAGEVIIKDVELSFFRHFPKVTVALHQVAIRDTMYPKHRKTFFEADEVFVGISLWKLLKKQSSLNAIYIKKGTFNLFTDSSGYTNQYLLKGKNGDSAKGTTAAGNNEFKSLDLEDVRLILDDKQKEKLYDFTVKDLRADIDDKNTYVDVRIDQDILVNSLAFNLPRGSFLKDKVVEGKFNLRYNKQEKQLQFDSIDLNIANHPFNLTGSFDLAERGGNPPQFRLNTHTKNIDYEFAKKLLTHKIDSALSFATLNGVVDVSAFIKGPLKHGDPLINVFWSTKNNDIASPLIELTNCSFTGSYTNEVVPGVPRKDPNSKIELQHLTGEWQGLPITSDNMLIKDLSHPELLCDLRSKFPLTTINDFLNSAFISLTAGEAAVNIIYKGPIARNTTYNSFVDGTITIKNGLVNYNPRDIPLKNVNGRIVFKNSNVFVEDLRCQVLNNNIIMEGSAKNVLTLVNTQVNKATLDWKIYSPALNLASFTSLLKERKKVVSKKSSKNKLQSTANKIDEILEKGSINVSLKADKLAYKKFEATNVNAFINVLENSWVLQTVNLSHAGGQMNISGALENKYQNYHEAKAKITLKNVSVNTIFYAFNNFGQDGITSESIHGKLSSNINVAVGLDDNGQVIPSSVEGLIDFSLKNGALINYEPVKKLQTFLFKRRDFDSIQFAELKDTLTIKNQEVKINRMEIQSNVLSMFVEGVFSMKKNTDISIQVPLSNLKKRKEDYKPENTGADSKGGTSVFIRGTPGPDGNVRFKYDLFHRFRKGK